MEQILTHQVPRSDTDNVEVLLRLPVPNHEPSVSAKSAETADARSIADSAYQSVGTFDSTDTIAAVTDVPSDLATRVFTIPGKDVLRFLKSPDPKQSRHYSAILPAIQAGLQAALAQASPDGQVPWDKLVFQPMVIGKNEQEAKLHMAVLCEPDLASILEEGFEHGPMQSVLAIPNTGERLGYIVIPEPFEEVNAELSIDIFTLRQYHAEHDTNCGAPLFFKIHGGRTPHPSIRQATFGGVIKVSFANGQARFYGMTAGHVMKEARQHRHQLSTDLTSSADTTQSPFGLSAWLSDERALSRPLDPDRLPGVAAQRTKPSHDWCLFEVPSRCNKAVRAPAESSDSRSQGLVGSHGHSILIAERPTFHDDASDPVLVLGAAAGTRSGVLSVLPASIWIHSCQTFISVYVLQMDDNHKVTKGDSGAWVVHAAGPALYGHVVATNTFGEAYIVPSTNAFENIRECLGATSVTLPNTDDLTADLHTKPQGLPSDTVRHRSDVRPHPGASNQLPSVLGEQKSWHTSFSDHKTTVDRLYLEAFRELELERHLMDFFLSPMVSPGSAWTVKQERDFLIAHSEEHALSTAQIYLDDKYRGSAEQSGKWMAVSQMRSHLQNFEPWSYDLSHGCHRRLLFLPKIDAQSLTALLVKITCFEAEALRNAVRMHATSDICLQVQISTHRPLAFQLQFDLPYFTTSRIQDLSTRAAKQVDFGLQHTKPYRGLIDFIRSIRESHTSVVISGKSHHSWVGFAIGSLIDLRDNYDVYEDDGEEDVIDEIDEDCALEPDLFATAGCYGSDLSGRVIWDPRTYFLYVLYHRLKMIRLRSDRLVQKIGIGLMDVMSNASNTEASYEDGLEAFQASSAVAVMLDVLRDRCRKTTHAWEKFSGCDGDISFFSDVGHDANVYLLKIKETFRELEVLETQVEVLVKRSTTTMQTLQLQMLCENQRLSRENIVILRKVTEISLSTSRLHEVAASSARCTQLIAEDNNKAARVNGRLAVCVTAIFMALVYFTSESALFAFERSPQNFWIAITVLSLGLLLLSLAIHVLEASKTVFTDRLNATLEKVAMPSPAAQASKIATTAWNHHMSDADTLHEKPGTIRAV